MDEDFEISCIKTSNNGENLVEESLPYILIPENDSCLHMIRDIETHYTGEVYDQNLPTIEDYNESTSVPSLFTLDNVFQAWTLYDFGNPYYQTSRQLFQFLRSQRVESPKNKDTMEGVKHDSCFTHVLEYPFAILLEEMNNTNDFNFLRFELMDELLNELTVRWSWSELV
jgi:hypothetical protein